MTKTQALLCIVLPFCGLLTVCSSVTPAPSTTPTTTWPLYPETPGGSAPFIQTDGMLLKAPGGSAFLVKGIGFGNEVWGNPSTSANIKHHQAIDYARVAAMGFNCIRFYTNYGLYEDDAKPYSYKQSGFDWLDWNIAQAKANGIYLILNMHYPQGGFQSNGAGDALWTNPSNQLRLAYLWKEIAKRYRNEPTIIGYGLVNEPVPTSSAGQWSTLAQNLINAIRSEDPYHLFFVERVCWTKYTATAAEVANLYFPTVNDPASHSNIVYEYHEYNPMEFTHQNASWIADFIGKFTVWPDLTRITAENETWKNFSNTPVLAPTATHDWQPMADPGYIVANTAYKIGRPVIQASGIGSGGTIWFDDIVIQEYDGVTLVKTTTASVDSSNGWSFWSFNGSGSGSLDTGITGASNNACLKITGTTGDANFGCDSLKFLVTQNHSYKITGRVKSNAVETSAIVRFRIDFYDCSAIHSWDKAYLQSGIQNYIDYAAAKNVPVYLGEFGAIRFAFESGRGGTSWLGDMIDILKAGNVNYNYHDYHEDAFGLYNNAANVFPDPAHVNQAAIDLFIAKQH